MLINLKYIITLALSGAQTAQSAREQFFQWARMRREEEQCGARHDLPKVHDVMCVSTPFIVEQ
jgi:hypothetical protein